MGATRWQLVRRSIAGVLLIALGLALWGSQAASPVAERQAFGIGLLLMWTAVGVGVLAGHRWARWLGLGLAVAGCLVALRSASQAGPDGDPLLLDLFFLADGPSFTWFGAAAGSMAFATLAAVAGLLLLRPIDAPDARGGRAGLIVLAAAGILLVGGVLLVVPIASRLPAWQVSWGIPPGAQEVHVVGTPGSVRIDPANVRAGEVYLVVDRSAWGVSFIGRTSPEEPDGMSILTDPGPLSDADVDRIFRGDTSYTSTWAGLGKVTEMVVGPGSYLFAIDDPTVLAQRGGGTAPPGTIAVLRVDP